MQLHQKRFAFCDATPPISSPVYIYIYIYTYIYIYIYIYIYEYKSQGWSLVWLVTFVQISSLAVELTIMATQIFYNNNIRIVIFYNKNVRIIILTLLSHLSCLWWL